MEDSWIYVDDDDDSSNCSLTDSDKIDSETEAELYSKIHYDNLTYINSENLSEKSSEFLIYNSPFNDSIFCTDREKNESTLIKPASEHQLFNQITRDNFSSGKRKSSEMDANCKESDEKLSLVKKHKSDSERYLPSVNLDSDSENINDSLQFKINNNENEEIIIVSNTENKSHRKIDTVVIDSSDSDGDLWVEPSSVEKPDLQLNLLKDTDPVFLSSSASDDEPGVSSPFVKRNSVLKNLSMPSIKTDKNPEGLWHINFEDLHRSKKYSRRYHENIDVTCSNCNGKGHISRSCPSPRVIKCFFCGGNHIGSKCSSRMCSNCYASGHERKNCWQKINRMFCDLCKIEGHTKGNCPDLWRRYHLTTKPTKQLNKAKKVQQDSNIYCWNCGKSGHFGGVCPLSHLSRSCFSTWPCVISYDNPKKLLKERLPFLRRFPHLSPANQNRHLNISCTSRKQDIHLKSRNELNVSSGSNGEHKGNKGPKKNLKFNKVQGIVKERNFPRTPKEKSPMKLPKIVDKFPDRPVSPNSLIKKELNKLRKQWKNQRKRAGLQFSESQATQDHVSEMNFDDNLPESVKQQAEKRFKKWKRNILNKLRRKRKQNESRGRELTNS